MQINKFLSIKKKSLLIIGLIIFLIPQITYSFENKIEYKINNEIITSVDVNNEVKFLTIFNPRLLQLDQNKILEISTDSIIKERIKKIEIKKYKEKLEIDQNYLNKIIETSYRKINLKSESEFIAFLKKEKLKFSEFKEKLIIDTLWNEIIFFKFRKKISIDEEKIKNEINKFKNKEYISYNLSELVFNLEGG